MTLIIPSSSNNTSSLYFHIPFCSKKCDYCHFYVIPERENHKEQLMEALKREWEAQKGKIGEKDLISVYFGGGTPALLGPERVQEILKWIRESCPSIENAEITLEANPENITLPLMKAFCQAGINRASIGVQTFNDPLLITIGREHSSQKAVDAVIATYEAGIRNISIDLMYDLPGQTLSNWKSSLETCIKLPISHLSLYNLTIEPHTVFFKKEEQIRKAMPEEDVSTQMYELAQEVMEKHGLQQYEISAFAKDGAWSKHNTGYWTGRPFLGLGPSAFSHWNGQRFRNIASLSKYHKALKTNESPIDYQEELTKEEQIREALVIQLRLLCGVNIPDFEKRHAPLENETQDIIKRLLLQGLLHQENNTLSLTKKGILFYDTVASELI
ncbi:MAG: oxygen-independent coproporphyrinogen-3 oxidase [Chlamydiales bacterium]|jgi:oxygen-independent coproporphyrinogen-3 oxidase